MFVHIPIFINTIYFSHTHTTDRFMTASTKILITVYLCKRVVCQLISKMFKNYDAWYQRFNISHAIQQQPLGDHCTRRVTAPVLVVSQARSQSRHASWEGERRWMENGHGR